MHIGYARTSTIEQVAGLEAQLEELKRAGCEKIFNEHASSVVDERPELHMAINFAREGDTFVVTKIDRLARTVTSFLTTIKQFEEKGVKIRILNLGVDTNTPTGKLILTVLAGVAEFERDIMLERQREGIEKAKLKGLYKGRHPMPNSIRNEVMRLVNEGHYSKISIAKFMKISESTLHRFVRMEHGKKIPKKRLENKKPLDEKPDTTTLILRAARNLGDNIL